jgi:DNA-binding response OmpR family regulator
MVNDEEDLLTLCKETLEESGHTVEIVMSGDAAVERALEDLPDLLILDWVMPDMDGQALLHIWKSRPALESVCVLAISALQDGAVLAERAGADDFLQKPFGADDLLDAANQLLSRRKSGGAREATTE